MDSSASGLFSLPSELRLPIYEHALLAPSGSICFCTNRTRWKEYVDHTERTIKRWYGPGCPWSQDDLEVLKQQLGQHYTDCHQSPSLALLATCRQIYHEARNVVFEVNTFFLAMTPNPLMWRMGSRLGPAELQIPASLRAKVQYLFVHVRIVAEAWVDKDVPAIGSLGGLKHLGLALCYDGAGARHHVTYMECCSKALSMVIDRVPATTGIRFGPQRQEERTFMALCRAVPSLSDSRPWDMPLVKCPPEEMKQIAKSSLEKRTVQKAKLLAWLKDR